MAARVPREIMMASVNVRDAASLASRYGVQGTPTTLFLSSGTEVNRIEGKATKEELEAAVQSAFNITFTAPAQDSPAPAPSPAPVTPPAPRPAGPAQTPTVQISSGPSTKAIVAGVVGIALALAGFALIVGGKD